MRRKRPDIKFSGFDWTELSAIWKKEYAAQKWPKDTKAGHHNEEDDAKCKWIEERILDAAIIVRPIGGKPVRDGDFDRAKWEIRQVRRFLIKMANPDRKAGVEGNEPFYFLATKIESPLTLAQWLQGRIGWAWN